MIILKHSTTANQRSKLRNILHSVGNKIGSVWFIKKSDGTLRKMTYRVNVETPSHASMPSGKSIKKFTPDVMTVFDVNKIRYNSQNEMSGRGEWRSVPLDNIIRMKVNGTIYKIVK